nr:MAG TPA: hypothetical protein [Caudoviricetes sp.]
MQQRYTASSSQASYPLPRRTRHGALIPLRLLFRKEPLCWVLFGVTGVRRGMRKDIELVMTR